MEMWKAVLMILYFSYSFRRKRKVIKKCKKVLSLFWEKAREEILLWGIQWILSNCSVCNWEQLLPQEFVYFLELFFMCQLTVTFTTMLAVRLPMLLLVTNQHRAWFSDHVTQTTPKSWYLDNTAKRNVFLPQQWGRSQLWFLWAEDVHLKLSHSTGTAFQCIFQSQQKNLENTELYYPKRAKYSDARLSEGSKWNSFQSQA